MIVQAYAALLWNKARCIDVRAGLNMYCGVPFVKLSVFNLSAERSERGGALARPPYSHRHGMVSRRMLHGDGCATESKEQENRETAR